MEPETTYFVSVVTLGAIIVQDACRKQMAPTLPPLRPPPPSPTASISGNQAESRMAGPSR